jgi:type II secretory pathway pseudopilin PulG
MGVVLLVVLLFILITTLAAGSMVELYQSTTRRENEEQLLFVGEQYRRAIYSYYNSAPAGSTRALPRSLQDLIEDRRFPTSRTHLRQLYVDPMTGKPNWALNMIGAGIVGVHSISTVPPFKTTGFGQFEQDLSHKSSYAEWNFSIKL